MNAMVKECALTVECKLDNYELKYAQKEKYEDQRNSPRLVNTVIEDMKRPSKKNQDSYSICDLMEIDYDVCKELESSLDDLFHKENKKVDTKILFYDQGRKYPHVIHMIYKLHKNKAVISYFCATPEEVDAVTEN